MDLVLVGIGLALLLLPAVLVVAFVVHPGRPPFDPHRSRHVDYPDDWCDSDKLRDLMGWKQPVHVETGTYHPDDLPLPESERIVPRVPEDAEPVQHPEDLPTQLSLIPEPLPESPVADEKYPEFVSCPQCGVTKVVAGSGPCDLCTEDG